MEIVTCDVLGRPHDQTQFFVDAEERLVDLDVIGSYVDVAYEAEALTYAMPEGATR